MKTNFLLMFAFLMSITTQAQCWKQLDAGGFFTVGIKDDGTLWGWGHAWSGELGAEQYDFYAATPVQIGNDNDWEVVSAGNGHVMALKTDGSLWTWGRNDSGQLGNGEITSNLNATPQQIGNDNDWAYISAGHIHSTAIKTNGTLWMWGANNYGQLGNGTIDTEIPQTIVPTQVGTDTNWKSVDASWTQNVAIKTDGTLWEWGANYYLPMSNGSTSPVTTPIQIGTDSDWNSAVVGGFAITAIREDGSLWSWGFNQSGGVGNGSVASSLAPVQIGTGKWRSITRGMNYFAGAIKDDGTLWTWGYNHYGPVGDGTTVDKLVPVQVPSDVAWDIYTGGGDFSVALKADGTMQVWGYNYNGELGFNLSGNTILTPVTVDVCSSLATIESQHSAFSVYPNPVQDILYITGNIHNTGYISVYDITGKLIRKQELSDNQIQVQDLLPGVYLLKIVTSGATHTTKFVKH